MVNKNYFMKGKNEDANSGIKDEFKKWLKTNQFQTDLSIENSISKLDFIGNMFARNISEYKSVFDINVCEIFEIFTKNLLNHSIFATLNKNEKDAYELCLTFYEKFLSSKYTITPVQLNHQNTNIKKTMQRNSTKSAIDDIEFSLSVKKSNEEKFKQWLYFNKQLSIEKAERILTRINQIESVFTEKLDTFSSITEIMTLCDFQSVKVNLLEDTQFRELDKKCFNSYIKSLTLFEDYLKKPKINTQIKKISQPEKSNIRNDKETTAINDEKIAAPQLKYTEKQKIAFDNQALTKKNQAIEEKKVDVILAGRNHHLNDSKSSETLTFSPHTRISEVLKFAKYQQFLKALEKDGILSIEELMELDVFKYLNEHDIYFYKMRLEIFEEIKEILKVCQVQNICQDDIVGRKSVIQESPKEQYNAKYINDINQEIVSLDDENSYIRKKPEYFTLNGLRYNVSKWDDVLCLLSEQFFKLNPIEMAELIDKPCFENSELILYSRKPINYQKERKLSNGIFVVKFSRINIIIKACYCLCNKCSIHPQGFSIYASSPVNIQSIKREVPQNLSTKQITQTYPLIEIKNDKNENIVAESNIVSKSPEVDSRTVSAVDKKNEHQTVDFDDIILGKIVNSQLDEVNQVASNEIVLSLSDLDDKYLDLLPVEVTIDKQTLAVKNWVDLYANLIKYLTTTHIEILKLLRYKNIVLPNHKKIMSYTSVHLKDPQYIGKNLFLELALDHREAFLACKVLCEKCKIDLTKIAVKLIKNMNIMNNDKTQKGSMTNDYDVDDKDTTISVKTEPIQSKLQSINISRHEKYIQSKSVLINDFLKARGLQTTYFKEIREKFDLYNDYLKQIIRQNTQFVEILDNQYIHRDNIIDLEIAMDDMETILKTHFNQFLGYSNNQLLYKAFRISNMLFLNDNDLDDMEKVYFLAKHVFGREKKLGAPCVFYGNKHIWQKTPDFPKSTIGLLINYARSKDSLITREECETYLEKICITITSIRQILKIGSTDTFLQYDTDQYLLKESLRIDGEWLQQLNECLAVLFAETNFAIIRDINKEWYQKLPRLPYGLQWTPLFLQEVLYYEKVIKYRTITAIRGQRYDTLHAAIVPENSDIDTFGDVVYTLLFNEKMVDKRYEGEELRQILKKYGLIEKNELYASMPHALDDYRFAWDSDKKTVFINGGA